MKKQKNDRQKTSELLQKLQAAVLSSSQTREKKQEQSDPDDVEFRNKIADMLSRIAPESNKSSTNEAAKQAEAGSKTAPASKPSRQKQSPAERQTKKRTTPETAEQEAPEARADISPKSDRQDEATAPATQPKQQPEPTKRAASNRKGKKATDISPAEPARAESVAKSGQPEQRISDMPPQTVQTSIQETAPAPEASREVQAPLPETQPDTPSPNRQASPAKQKASTVTPTATATDSPPERSSGKPAAPRSIQTLTSADAREPDAKAAPASGEKRIPNAVMQLTAEQPYSNRKQEKPEPSEREELPPADRQEASKERPASAVKATGQTVHAAEEDKLKAVTSPTSSRQVPPAGHADLSEQQQPVPVQRASAAPTGRDTAAPSSHRAKNAAETAAAKKDLQGHPSPISEQRATMQKQKKEQTQPSENVSAKPPKPAEPKASAPEKKVTVKKEQSSSQDVPIVIHPQAPATSTEPIVIKPRQNTRTAEPTKVVTPTPEQVTPSVRVEKPASARQAPARGHQVTLPKSAVKPKPAPEEKPKQRAEGAAAPSAGTSTKHGMPHVSFPALQKQGTAGKASPAPKKPLKKRPSQINRTRIVTLPEDENLDEALDDVIADESTVEILPMEEPEVIQPISKKASVFSRRKEKKAAQAEQALNAMTVIEKKTGMTEDDIAMIFELGYENELGRLVGYETLKKLRFEHIRKHRRSDERQYRTAFGYRNTEYTGNQKRDTVLAQYAKDKKHLLLRLFFTALITLLLIPADLPDLFGSALMPYRSAYPLLLPVCGLLLLLAAGLLSLRQLSAGIRSFFRFTPTPYSLNALLVPLSLLCGILSVWAEGGAAPVPLNLSAASSLLLSACCDALRLSDEMRCFRIASAEGDKTVLDPAEPRKKKLRQGDKIVKIINDDVDQSLYRVRKSEQTAGFFRRCNDFSAATRPFQLLLCTALSLSVCGGLLGAVHTDSIAGALSGFASALIFTAPTSAVFLFFYPLCCANRRLSHRNCALIGAESVEEYSQPKTVIFRDSDMYAAQKCTQISVREEEDFRQDMKLAGILFRKMSGTLGSVGQNAPMSGAKDPSVAFVRLTENGTEAVVDSQYHLLAGNAAFMNKSGVRVPKESTDRTLRRAGNVSLMYVAIDGVLKLSYEIEYTVAPRFEDMVNVLAGADTLTAIQTYDPNLNDAFLQASRPDGAEYVRVIKPGRYEQDSVQEVADSGAIALGGTLDIARPLLAASAIQRLHTCGFRLLFAAVLVGGIAAGALILNRASLLPGTLVLLPMLMRGVWLAATWLVSRVVLHAGQDELDLRA